MDFIKIQERIDAIRKTLDEAKAHSGLAPDDAAVIMLEKILLTKIANLETAKMGDAPEAVVRVVGKPEL